MATTKPTPGETERHTRERASRNGRSPRTAESSPPPATGEADSHSEQELFGELIAKLRQMGFKRSPKLVDYLEERVFSWLKEAHVVGGDIEALQQAGVRREIIGLSLIGISLGSVCDQCQETFGDKRARQREQNLLLAPIGFLNKLGKEWEEDGNPGSREVLLSPLDVAKRLETYADMLKLRDQLRQLAGVDSVLDVAKYIFVGAVKRITGTYHDREVSALIAAMTQDPDYHMEVHKFWRRRLYSRLEQTLATAGVWYLYAVNSILIEG
jgi:hypothetical protein